MLWVKAFHLIFMVTWFAGLFYLPRLFVYHAEMPASDGAGHDRFVIMERRLLRMTHLGATLTIIFGLWLLLGWRQDLLTTPWFQFKLALVALLLGYHAHCAHYGRQFALGRNRHGSRFYRIFNEMPVIALIGIILLATLKTL